MNCTDLLELAEHEPDAPLPASVAAHLNSCQDCRSLWDDLDAIRTAGRELGAEEVAPPERLWVALRSQLESEGLIRAQSQPAFTWLDAFLGRGPRLAMAGAYLSLLLIAAGFISFRSTAPSVLTPGVLSSDGSGASPVIVASSEPAGSALAGWSAPDIRVDGVGQKLDGDMKRVMAQLPERDSVLVTSIQQNLGIVDNLIAVCEKSVREQPGNQLARQYLYGAYQQKAVLLATAMDHSTLEDR